MSLVVTCLQELGRGLVSRGVSARLVSGEAPVLRVRNPGPPALDEIIGCRLGPDGDLWFSWVALGVLLAPVRDVGSACERVALVLAMSEGENGGPRGPRCGALVVDISASTSGRTGSATSSDGPCPSSRRDASRAMTWRSCWVSWSGTSWSTVAAGTSSLV